MMFKSALLVVVLATLALGQDECDPYIAEIDYTCTNGDIPGAFERLVDPEDCTAYYYCDEGCGGHADCPVDQALVDDNGLILCDDVCNVDCGDRPCDICENCAEPCTGDDCDCPEEDGYYEYEDNCIKYKHCVNQQAEILVCGFGGDGRQLYFLQEQQWCDYDENVDCGSRPICDEDDDNCFCEGEDICSIQACSGSEYIEEGPCTKCLCQCNGAGNTAEELCCGSGLVWDPAGDACKDPSEVPTCDGTLRQGTIVFPPQARENATEIVCPRP